MKLVFRILLVIILDKAFVSESHGQNYEQAVRNLNSIYKNYGASTSESPIKFDSLKRILFIDKYEIPMSDNTFIQCVKNRRSKGGMRFSAKFYMQQGEIITYQGNDMIQKAFLSIPLSDKASCKRFVFYLEQLKKEY